MNKTAIRNFAVSARIKLMEAVKQEAFEIGVTKTGIQEPEIYQDGFRVNDRFFKKYEIQQRNKLIQSIRDKGFEQVIEEVAYTWFNRFIAIRFMEVNDYLPIGVRVLSSTEQGKIEPDVIGQVLDVSEELDLDLDIVYRLQDANDTEDLFKYIFIKQCNKLGEIMPVMFERIEDYTELLLPNQLLSEGSVLRDIVMMIAEDDWKEQVEIIGWLYQYYISEKKDQVFADLKKNKKITKENIPAATQLFTPKWIVKYMVENSLGRLWLESHPNEELKQQWKYYLEEAEQEPEVQEQLEKLKNKNLKPEEIKVLDPCMGSGHILVYAFDVLYQMYLTDGYEGSEIPRLILEKNIYGLDIDDRAAQLAYFALMMKARSYSRRIFRKPIELNVCAIQESNGIPEEAIEYFVDPNGLELENSVLKADVEYLVQVFKDAKEYGSILNVEAVGFEAIEERLEELRDSGAEDLFGEQYREILLEKLPELVKQGRIMSEKYEIVVTNPPYMGNGGMNKKLSDYLGENYPVSKTDLFAAFIEKTYEYNQMNGFCATINQHSWMFLSTYEKLRLRILNQTTLYSMIHLGPRAFEDISGEVVQSTSYITRRVVSRDYKSVFVKLTEVPNPKGKEVEYFNSERKYYKTQVEFLKLPGSPVAYEASQQVIELFRFSESLEEIAEPKQGSTLGNNDEFLRFWYEVVYKDSNPKWRKCLKGGSFRKWYGNHYYVVNWEDNGREVLELGRATIRNKNYLFKRGISWSRITTGMPSFRVMPDGYFFESASGVCFPREELLLYILGLLNSKVVTKLVSMLNNTVTIQSGNIKSLPVIILPHNEFKREIEQLVNENIHLAKEDWDSSEISWDFKMHPLLLKDQHIPLITNVYNDYQKQCGIQFEHLKKNEERLNELFISIYGLSEEITPEVQNIHINMCVANKERDIKSFLSYTVGCMLGRYSLDQEGLVYAGGEFDESKYVTFPADRDNIIPITDDEYFEDDVVSRFIQFVRVTFGEETLEDNLEFIADALVRKANETARQRIRRYFLKEFYADHLQTYQKRPIYWLFDSGKNDGFKALIYMHRYDIDIVAKVRTDYLHTLQRKYEAEINRLDALLDTELSAAEKTKSRKQREKLQKQLLECQAYDQVIAYVADQRIAIDLDDGVKVNYAKFQDVEVPQGEGKKPLKANLLAKI